MLKNTRSLLPSLPSQIPPTTTDAIDLVQVARFCRRPFVEIFVEECHRPKANAAALEHGRSVAHTLMANGIDVTLDVTGGSRWVTYAELGALIKASEADFYVCLNANTRIISAPSKRRLVHEKLPDFIAFVWKSWPQNPWRNYDRVQRLTPEQLQTLVHRYTGIARLHTQLQNVVCAQNGREAADMAIHLHRAAYKGLAHLLNPEKTSVLPGQPEDTLGRFHSQGRYAPNNTTLTPDNTIHPFLHYRLVTFIRHVIRDVEARYRRPGVAFSQAWVSYYYREHLPSTTCTNLFLMEVERPVPPPFVPSKDEEEEEEEKKEDDNVAVILSTFCARMARAMEKTTDDIAVFYELF